MYNSAQFVNLSTGALGVYGETSTSLIRFISDLGMNKKLILFCTKYVMCIQCTYYIFFYRNKEWASPFLTEDYYALYFCVTSMVIVPITLSCNLVILWTSMKFEKKNIYLIYFKFIYLFIYWYVELFSQKGFLLVGFF